MIPTNKSKFGRPVVEWLSKNDHKTCDVVPISGRVRSLCRHNIAITSARPNAISCQHQTLVGGGSLDGRMVLRVNCEEKIDSAFGDVDRSIDLS